MKLSVSDVLTLCDRFREAIVEGQLAQVIMPNMKPFAECSGSYVASLAKDLRKFAVKNQRLAATVRRYYHLMEGYASDPRATHERSDWDSA
jgi:hypothetical protein